MTTEKDPLIRDADGAELIGCSKATWWRRVADGTLPEPVKIGGISRWPLSEIVAVIEAAKAARGRKVSEPFAPTDQPPPHLAHRKRRARRG